MNSFLNRIFKLTVIFFLTGLAPVISAQVERVEPPNWWAGMHNPDLEVMIYGNNIANTEISLDYPGVTIKRIIYAQNPHFIFLDLHLDPDVNPGTFDIILDKNGQKTAIPYELKKRTPGSAKREGFNNSDVIYLLVPDRFANGNTDNDNIKGYTDKLNRKDNYGRHGGDLKGISDHVDYMADMGFTALWPTPVLENSMKRASYHGYAITDFYKVDPRFGSNEDYFALSRKLHEKGIKLIQDMVFNHCGSEHWWMKDMPFDDWINYYPDLKITNHQRTVNEDPYASDYDKNLMSDGWFVTAMPDLNQKNPFMETYLIQNSIWWIESAGLSGIRMDTYPYPDKFAMANWTRRILDEYPYFNLVGEEWSYNPAIVSYWQKDQVNRDKYVSYLPSLMDFPLQSALYKALTQPEGWGSGWNVLYETVALDFLYPHPDNLVTLLDNHDMARFFMQLNKDTALYNLGVAWLLTMRGIPQVFYGSEILMDHPENNEHGDIRKDFPGGWEGDKSSAFTGEGLSKEQIKEQEYYKTLLNWRKSSEVVQSGSLKHFAPDKGCYVYFRYNNDNRVMVVLNKNKELSKLPLNRYVEMLNGYKSGKDVISGKTYKLEWELEVPAQKALILELN